MRPPSTRASIDQFNTSSPPIMASTTTSPSDSQPSEPSSLTGRLATWISRTDTPSIPPSIRERAKHLILDGLACGLVGAHLPWSKTAANGIFKMEGGGKVEPCSIIGWGGKRLSPVPAALLNSTFIQGFELDDYHSKAPLHSNSLLLPVLFAAAQAEGGGEGGGRKVTGEEMLKAYVVGCEIGPRVGLALRGADLLSRGWHSGALQGPSAAAAAVSSLLGLSAQQTEWALGTACTQAGGLMSAQFGSMAKRMQHGFAARNGLFAALMARENYTGIEQVYETPYGGFLGCFGEGATVEPKTLPDELVKGLGERWELEGVRVKLHAAMAALHCPIDCMAKLQGEHPELFKEENLGKIKSIQTEISKAAYEHGGWTAPRDKPLSSVGAQMSIQYAVAAQLVDGQVLMEQFGAPRLNRPQLRELMAKVQPVHQAGFDKSSETTWRTIATVRFEDGTEVSATLNAAKGTEPEASNEEIVQKWRKLVSGILDDHTRDEIENCVLRLETLDDITKLAKLLEVSVECPIAV